MPLLHAEACATSCLRLLDRKPRLIPRPPASVERDGVGVTHLLNGVRGERRSKAAAAIQYQRRVLVGDLVFDIALDYALAQMYGPRGVPVLPLAVFSHIDQ